LTKKHSSITEDSSTVEPRFYKLPFIGRYSNTVQKRINKIVIKCCSEDFDIHIIFRPFRIVLFLKIELMSHLSLLWCTNFNVQAI